MTVEQLRRALDGVPGYYPVLLWSDGPHGPYEPLKTAAMEATEDELGRINRAKDGVVNAFVLSPV